MKSVFSKSSDLTGDDVESKAVFSERSVTASNHETILLRAGLVMAVFLALLAVSAAAHCALLSGPLVKSSSALRFVMRSTSLSGVAREQRGPLGIMSGAVISLASEASTPARMPERVLCAGAIANV